jgi:hypothetical protein
MYKHTMYVAKETEIVPTRVVILLCAVQYDGRAQKLSTQCCLYRNARTLRLQESYSMPANWIALLRLGKWHQARIQVVFRASLVLDHDHGYQVISIHVCG